MTFSVGAGYRFEAYKGKRFNVTYVPSLSLGLMVGGNNSVIIKQGEWWEFDGYHDPFTVQGFGGEVTNRFEINTVNDKFGLFYEHKFGYYKLEHGVLDGKFKYNLGFMGNSVGMKFMILNPNNHKKKKR
jgi:hypothetical protein